jgi:integrase
MHAGPSPHTPDLFDEPAPNIVLAWQQAFDHWLATRQHQGTLREASSVAVYASMWGALTAWCVARAIAPHTLRGPHLQAYLHSRGGHDELTPRYAWRLLTLVDAVLAQQAQGLAAPTPTAAHTLLMSTPEWRYANAADKTPLPEHLHAAEARRLVAWLLDPASTAVPAGAAPQAWQSLRNRTAVALQLGAGLTPGDVRACTVHGVISVGGRVRHLPWKLQLPAHGSTPEREAPLAPWAGRLLRTWLEARTALQIAGPALFPSTRTGKSWGKVAQYSAARAVLAAAGVPDTEGGSFKLRHTFALRQLRRGSAPEQVAQWLGLADTAALARYRRVLLAPADVI